MSYNPIEYYPYVVPNGEQIASIGVPQSEYVRAKGAARDITILYAGVGPCAAVALVENVHDRRRPTIVFGHIDDGEPVIPTVQTLTGDETLRGKEFRAFLFSGMSNTNGISRLLVSYFEKRRITFFADIREKANANFALDLATGRPIEMVKLPNQKLNGLGIDFVSPPILLEIPRYMPNDELERLNSRRIFSQPRVPRMKLAFDMRKGQVPGGYRKLVPNVPQCDRIPRLDPQSIRHG